MHWQWMTSDQIKAAMPEVVLAAVLFLVGAVFVFWGWKIYRVALALMGALVGFVVGGFIASLLGVSAIFVALPLAVICAFLAIFLQKVGVFLVSGLWGAFLVLGAHEMIRADATRCLAAGAAFFVVGILAVLLWRPMITFLLAMFGAGLIANAATMTADLFKSGAAARWETAHPWIMFAAICVVAGIGLYYQEEEERAEESD
jgi:hypothetical protein